MTRLAQVRKAIAAALGTTATLIVLLPEGMVPEQWRPWVGLVLAVATVAGVYKAPNAPPPTRVARPGERPRRGGYESGDTPASELRPPSTGIKRPRRNLIDPP